MATNTAPPLNKPVTVNGGTMILSQKPTAWTANSPGSRHNFSMLTVTGGGGGGGGGAVALDVTNNLVNVNYGMAASPYNALRQNVASGVITETTSAANRTVGIYDTAMNLDGTTPGGTTVRLGYACPGDTMLRGKVDSSDIVNILSAGHYNIGPSNARWDQGDFNHDGKVDSSDIIGILAAGVYNSGPYDAGGMGPSLVIGGLPSAGRATLIYDAASGDVKLDPNGNTMTGFRLLDGAGSFFVGSAIFPPGGAFTTDTAAEKFWGCFNPPNYLTSEWDLGDIAPAGLTEVQFEAGLNNLSGDSVWTKAGGGSFDYNFSSVPEPSSMVLLAVGLGLLGLLVRRRRRA